MTYQTINPTNNKLIKSWKNHSDQELEQALTTADKLFHSDWAKGPIQPRLQVLDKLAALIDSKTEALARAASIEMGKLIGQSKAEVTLCADIARYYAKNAENFLAPTKYETDLGEAWVEHHPVGVIVAVEPWNFPFYQLMRVLAPNLAAGNPVLVKHASIVPHCATLFEALVTEAGAPQGAWTNIFATSDQVATLIADDRVQGAALTGSEKAGSAVAEQAGKYLKKTTLELGGNDVFVVLDDCDLEKAVEAGVAGRLANCGQVCTAAKRFVLDKSIADKFLEKFIKALKDTKIGDPLDPDTTLGPLSCAEARDNLQEQVDNAVAKGAKVLLGGHPVDGDGNFYQPTILTDISRDNPAYFEEFFGPVAQVYIVENDDQIVNLANDSHYGLGGSIFTQDIARGKALASRIETGMVYINSATSTAAELPFGGIKRSGYGRELSDLGIKEFVNQKLVVVSG